jgi:V-type H+-transporting ATPase subunit B
MSDPRESSSYSIVPRIRYNTVGGINGPLVILENVWDLAAGGQLPRA